MRLRACAVCARISEQTPRDLVGVGLLSDRLALAGVPGAPPIEGRHGPFGVTPWRDDLEASRSVLEQLAAWTARVQADACPLTLASDCAVALATLPAMAAAVTGLRVLWLDAHSDYDTPETTTYSFLGAMSLAGATGAWATGLGAIEPARVVLLGPRPEPDAFDSAAQAAVERSPVTVLRSHEHEQALAALGSAPVYVHLDTDVLDPADNPLPYARPDGLRLGELRELLVGLAARGPVAGMELTAFHASEDEAERTALADEIADLVSILSR